MSVRPVKQLPADFYAERYDDLLARAKSLYAVLNRIADASKTTAVVHRAEGRDLAAQFAEERFLAYAGASAEVRHQLPEVHG